jgi:hypothetical protein
VYAHRLFCKGQCASSFAFVAPFQESAAQKRKVLHANAVSPSQRKIGPYLKLRARLIVRNAFEDEHAEFHFWKESFENESHLDAPYFTLRNGGYSPAFRCH